MMQPSRILAVEPDPANAHALKQFVQSCVTADMLVAESVAAAKAALAQFTPDLVLVSELVTADDDVALTSHVRSSSAGRTLPILSVPAMAGAEEDTAQLPRGVLRLIASGGALADGPRTMLARRQAALRQGLKTILQPRRTSATAPVATAAQRPRAARWKGDNIPWLTHVTMPLGLEVRLINISRSGLLIESRGRFLSGQPAAFELHGRLNVVVPGRFVRASADADGNGYFRSAATFDDDLPLFAPTTRAASGVTVTSDLGDVLAWVRTQARSGLRPERIRAAFELRVQELVGARAVLICRVPAQADEPGDSVCLPVPTSDGSEAFLQAIYDAARPLPTGAFESLKAAAALAADVLEMEHIARAAQRT
jgi:CheY-like chemotaxis protein